MMLPSKSILSFYSNQPIDHSNRKLEEIWKFNDDELEGYHTYIQWLFPLTEPSAFNFAAPVLDKEVILEFKHSPVLQQRLLTSLQVMLKFYGFQIEESNPDIRIVKSDEFAVKKLNWINHGNHNFLRITRILTCLRLLGLEKYSKAFFACLKQVYAEESFEIGEVTLDYWRRTQMPIRDLGY